MLTEKERDVLHLALSKYRPGQSEPILIGSEKLLKPALKLMSFYRLRIDEIKEDAVLTNYTRWLESVQVRGTENQEVYVTFIPLFERIWLESKKHLLDYVEQNPANLGLRSQYSIRLYGWAKKHVSVGEETHFIGAASKSAWTGVGKGCQRKYLSKRLPCQCGRTFVSGRWTPRWRRSPRRRT